MNTQRKRPVEREYTMLRVVTNGLHQTNRLIIVLWVVLACLGVYGLCLPQKKELMGLQNELASREAEAEEVREERDQLRQEVLWLNSDPDYLEIIARDRNDLFKDGETVYRIERKPARVPLDLE